MSIDPNVVMAAAATDLTKTFFLELKKSSIDFFSRKYSYLFEDFSHYLNITYNRCNFVRTIINKDRSFDINDIYVPGVFKLETKEYSDTEVIQHVRDGHPTVILGFGGVGKTVFSKYLWLSVFHEPKGKIPVYLELRKLNSITDADLMTYIRRTISPNKSGIDQAVFQSFLDDGQFVFVFDGFDELSSSNKEKVSEEIIQMSYDFPRNGFVLSSRYDDRFASWQRFDVFKACLFNKKQVTMLLDKIPYDKDTRRKFHSEIISKKYETYQPFLSTPLLTLMMLMTFSQFAEVPEKRHIFYRYAFMTLYSWHDSSKESFNREKQTGLILDKFEKAFSIFCLISYLNRDYEFDHQKILNYIKGIKNYVEFEFDENKFLLEMINTVNLVYADGDSYLFTHRSFQEYFAAYAVTNYFQHKMIDIVPRLHRVSDMVFGLMYEINKFVVDECYVLPKYREYRDDISLRASAETIVDIQNLVEVRYVALFDLERDKGNIFPSIFGRDISDKTWGYICHIEAFTSGLDGDFTPKSEGFDDFYDEMSQAATKIVRKRSLEKKSSLLLSFSPGNSRLYFSYVDNASIDTIDNMIDDIMRGDSYLLLNRGRLYDIAVKDAKSIKSSYVRCERLLQNVELFHRTKDKSIDELLA